MSKLTQTQEAVLSLAATALFGEELHLPQDVDWQAVLKECSYQSVMLQVYPTVKPHLPEDIRKQWEARCARLIASNIRVEWEHTELHKIMEAASIPYVVMKGCASASFYPDPSIRTMGDVDFLINLSDIEATGKALEQAGFAVEQRDQEVIHNVYYRGSGAARSVWEMHWEPNGVPDGHAGRLIREYLSTAINDAILYETSAGVFMGPSVFHHGLIILLHTATHLINTGVGLRHLCDWAVFVNAVEEETFCRLFEEKLKAVGLWRFAQLLTQLSMVYLRCPEKKWADQPEEQLLEAMVADIFAGGNFGRKDDQRINQAKLMTSKGKGAVDDTPLLVQLIKTMNEKAQLELPAVKRYPVLLPIGWLYVGLRHIFRIMVGKRPKLDLGEMVIGANARKQIYKQFGLFESADKDV